MDWTLAQPVVGHPRGHGRARPLSLGWRRAAPRRSRRSGFVEPGASSGRNPRRRQSRARDRRRSIRVTLLPDRGGGYPRRRGPANRRGRPLEDTMGPPHPRGRRLSDGARRRLGPTATQVAGRSAPREEGRRATAASPTPTMARHARPSRTATVADDAAGDERVDLRVQLADRRCSSSAMSRPWPARGEVVVAERVGPTRAIARSTTCVHHPVFAPPLVALGA